MKILSLGLDNLALDKHSALARRIIEYGELVERYTVIVPNRKNKDIELSEKVKIYGSGGGDKLTQFFKINNLAKRLLRDVSYDVITVQDQYYLALIGLWLAKKFKVGLEIQVHGFEKFSGLRKLIAQYVLSRADAVRCVSQRLQKQLVGRLGVAEEKITVVPIHSELRIKNYSPTAKLRRTSELPIKKNGENFIFLTVGRLVAVKNVELQIEAMAEVVREFPHAELWIVGDGPEREKLEVRSKKLELENNIKLLGRKYDLEDYYNQADVFILTSKAEGWGLAVIEAASFSLPIIMTDVGCAGEVIKNSDSGLVIPVGDKQELVKAMLRIKEDVGLREKLAGNAKLAVYNLPTEDQTLTLYKKSWEKAVKNNMSAQGACLSGLPAGRQGRQGSASGRKLLILTQKVDSNDAILGFMPGWIAEFAKHCEKIIVVCLEKGVFSLPLNVKVLSLGKETGQAKIKYLINFYKYIWQERKNYDTVFVHMNPEYIVLAGWLWKMLGKRIALWYTHKQVDLKLRLAEKLADIIFTASAKSFRLRSKKINVMGHGIDIERFVPAPGSTQEKIILSVDRISPTKNQLEIIKLFAVIKQEIDNCRLHIVGAPAYSVDEDYFNQIKEYIKDHGLSGQVKLLGAVPNKDMSAIYQRAQVFINFSSTGSLDKAVLEAMACNVPVVTTNEAFKNILPAKNFSQDFADARQKVIHWLHSDNQTNYREIIVRSHSLKNLIAGITKKLS